MIKKSGLKILDFKSGKPKLSPLDWNRHLIDRIMEISNEIHERRRGQANWVLYTGMDGANLINEATNSTQAVNQLEDLASTTTVDGVEGQMRLLGVDMIDNDPTQLSMRYSFQPTRGLEYITTDFSITPSGENISFSG